MCFRYPTQKTNQKVFTKLLFLKNSDAWSTYVPLLTAPGHLQDQILWKYLYFSHTFYLLYLLLIHIMLNKMICGRIAPGSCFQLSFLWIRLGLIVYIWKDGRIQQRKGQESCKYWLLQIRRWSLWLFCLHTQSLSHDGARARGGNLIMTSIWSPLPTTLLVSHSVNLI